MINVYPYGSGSVYIPTHAITASYAESARFIKNVTSASNAGVVLNPRSGSRGKSVCLLTTEQYLLISGSVTKIEQCNFPE
jgi:hypothetical protein